MYTLYTVALTLVAGLVAGSGMFSAAVRAVVASVFREPKKTSVLIRHDDGEYDAVDVEDLNRLAFIEKLGELGLPRDQAKGLADTLRLKAPKLGWEGESTSSSTGVTGA